MGAARFLSLLPLTAAAVLMSTATSAQEGNGRLLTFGISQNFSWADNAGLTIPSEGSRLRADTQLSFGAVFEGPRDLLTFDSALVLRGEDDGSGFDFGVENPSAELGYKRSGATSSFTASAFFRESDLAEGLALSDDEIPVLVLENGSARITGGRLGYSFGDGAPFGGNLRAGLTDTDYTGTTDPDLVDNRTLTAGVGLHFSLNEVTEATLDIDHRLYDEAGAAPEESSTTVAAGLVRALPRGSLRARLSTTFDEGGSRSGLSFGRSIDLPNGALSLDLGLTESEGSGFDVTGAVAYQQELPRGGLSARLSRAVTTDAGNDETLVTALSLGLTQELTPRMGLNMGADWSRSEDTASGTVTDNASLDAALNYALTPDWNLNLGATHRMRDEDGIGRADSNSVFLSVGRTFEFRP